MEKEANSEYCTKPANWLQENNFTIFLAVKLSDKSGRWGLSYLNEVLLTKMRHSKSSKLGICHNSAKFSLHALQACIMRLFYVFVIGMLVSFELCQELMAEELNFGSALLKLHINCIFVFAYSPLVDRWARKTLKIWILDSLQLCRNSNVYPCHNIIIYCWWCQDV